MDNPPPELSDDELIRELPPKRTTDTAVGWEIRAHDVLRGRRVGWFRAQRLVREQSAAHDWRQHARATVPPQPLAPAGSHRLAEDDFNGMEVRR